METIWKHENNMKTTRKQYKNNMEITWEQYKNYMEPVWQQLEQYGNDMETTIQCSLCLLCFPVTVYDLLSLTCGLSLSMGLA